MLLYSIFNILENIKDCQPINDYKTYINNTDKKMLDQFRKKRLNLTHSFDTNKARVNSSEKRKQIQANLQKFKREVEQGSKPKSPSRSLNNFYQTKNANQMIQSPTMKDLINPFLQSNKKQKKNSEQIQSPRFKLPEPNTISKPSQQQKRDNPITISQRIPEQPQQMKSPTHIQEPAHMQKKEQEHPQSQQKLQRQISFGDQQLQRQINVVKSPRKQQSEARQMEPTYQIKQQNASGLNFNYNDSNYGSSSNGSSAIFFTSQFRDYLNRDKINSNLQNQPVPAVPVPPPPVLTPITHQHSSFIKKSEPSEHSQLHNQTDKELGQSFLKIGDEQLSQSNQQSRTKKMIHNQSGRSLAFSNNDQSMLRDSKLNNQYYEKQKYSQFVQGLVREKLDEELVLEIGQFGKNLLCGIVDKLASKNVVEEVRNIGKDMKILNKLINFRNKMDRRIKRQSFDAFLILKQYKFEEVKNQIKAQNFTKQLQQRKLKAIFKAWKDIGLENQKLIIEQNNKRDEKMKKNILQVFKMIWYDSKVKRQVDLFYLSKIFSALKSAVAAQQKKSQNLAIKHYCRSLKRRYFKYLEQGTQQIRLQREKQQLALNHYSLTMLKKYFEAWLEQCSKSPQYVSLTLTLKNMFKQTQNNGWLGIKTVDFSQYHDK